MVKAVGILLERLAIKEGGIDLAGLASRSRYRWAGRWSCRSGWWKRCTLKGISVMRSGKVSGTLYLRAKTLGLTSMK